MADVKAKRKIHPSNGGVRVMKRTKKTVLPLTDLSEFVYVPRGFPKKLALPLVLLLESHFGNVSRPIVTMFGKTGPLPRKCLSSGTMCRGFSYKNAVVPRIPLSGVLEETFNWAIDYAEIPFNLVLMNQYTVNKSKKLKDKVGMHSDVNSAIDQNFGIFSVSLGQGRDFDVEPRDKADRRKYRQHLSHRDLVLMKAGAQAKFLHGIPARVAEGIRYNLTFRVVR